MRSRSVVPINCSQAILGFLASSILGILLFCPTAISQLVLGAHSGLIYYAEGVVYVDGRAVHVAHQDYPVLNEGQVVQTGKGRVEIQLAPAVFMRLGASGSIRLIGNKLEDTQVELQKGAAIIEIVKMAKGNKIQIRCAAASTELRGTGVYRFDADPGTLRVYGGSAVVSSSDRRVTLGSGRSVDLNSNLPVIKFSVKKTDGLHMWAARRSFFLFTSNPEALKNQFNWGITASGWSTNRDFHVRLYSPLIAQAYARKQALEASDKAQDKQLQDAIRAQEREQILEQQREQQRQQQQPPPPQNRKP